MSTLLADPAFMMERGAPHVIHTEDELEHYTIELEKLTGKEHQTLYDREAIELLTVLIERYEDEHYSIPEADPITVVKYLMEKQELNQKDLVPEFGSEPAVSYFLSGQRQLTLAQVQKLSHRFKLSTDAFIVKP